MVVHLFIHKAGLNKRYMMAPALILFFHFVIDNGEKAVYFFILKKYSPVQSRFYFFTCLYKILFYACPNCLCLFFPYENKGWLSTDSPSSSLTVFSGLDHRGNACRSCGSFLFPMFITLCSLTWPALKRIEFLCAFPATHRAYQYKFI